MLQCPGWLISITRPVAWYHRRTGCLWLYLHVALQIGLIARDDKAIRAEEEDSDWSYLRWCNKDRIEVDYGFGTAAGASVLLPHPGLLGTGGMKSGM